MNYFTINGVDYSGLVSKMKVGYETLISDNSSTNANGDTVFDIINTKRRLSITFRPMSDSEMNSLLTALEGFVVEVGFLNPKTKGIIIMNAYTNTPEPEFYTIQSNKVMYKSMSLNFIEL